MNVTMWLLDRDEIAWPVLAHTPKRSFLEQPFHERVALALTAAIEYGKALEIRREWTPPANP